MDRPSAQVFLMGVGTALAVVLLLPTAAQAQARDPVAVAAGAEKDYLRQRSSNSVAGRPETFVIAEGTYFGGKLRDPALEKTRFPEIADTLAHDLARHRYYPAPGAGGADLLIVVHWGITAVEEDASHGQLEMERLDKDAAAYNAGASKGGITDPGALNSDLDAMRAQSGLASSGPMSNAALLGYSDELAKEEYRSGATASGMTELDRRLRGDLQDERYFLILMAYDLTALRTAQRSAKPRLLWSTHISMRAIGHSFTSALPEMSSVAGKYFGTQSEGLLLDARNAPEGRVIIGEPRAVPDSK